MTSFNFQGETNSKEQFLKLNFHIQVTNEPEPEGFNPDESMSEQNKKTVKKTLPESKF